MPSAKKPERLTLPKAHALIAAMGKVIQDHGRIIHELEMKRHIPNHPKTTLLKRSADLEKHYQQLLCLDKNTFLEYCCS